MKIANYRKGIGYTQSDVAKIFGISLQAYSRKERGLTAFNDKEKVVFRDLVKPAFPNVSVESLFFTGKVPKVVSFENKKME